MSDELDGLQKRLKELEKGVSEVVERQGQLTKIIGDFQRDVEGVFSGPETNEPEPQSTPSPRTGRTTATGRTPPIPPSFRGRGHAEQPEPEGEPEPEPEGESAGDTITPPPPHWYFRRAFGRE